MTLHDALIVFGIIPSIAIGVYCYVQMYLQPFRQRRMPKGETETSSSEMTIPKKTIGQSEITKVAKAFPANQPSESGEPVFKTLRVSLEKVSKASWRFRIRFLLFNDVEDNLTLDDMHAIVYIKFVPSPPLLTIGYRGEALLLQDNSIWKDNQTYSLNKGDGFEMTLVMEMSRLEGSPVYGTDREKPGSMIVVFGTFMDYYVVSNGSIVRKALPSDTVYFFQCLDHEDAGELRVVDDEFLKEVGARKYRTNEAQQIVSSLGSIREEHIKQRPIPKA